LVKEVAHRMAHSRESQSDSEPSLCYRGVRENVEAVDLLRVNQGLGHKDVKTTMLYTHVLNRGGKCVKSPVDDL